MKKKKKVYVFDIDGVVCETTNGNYEKAKPIKARIDQINKLYGHGHTIIFFTSRGKLSGINWEKLTNYQFKEWKIKNHGIIFGKPYADVYVDDHAINDKEFFKLK